MTVVEHMRDTARPNSRPAFAQPRLVLFVLLGGALGTGGREGIALLLPSPAGGIPWAVLVVNLVGAFLLGFLLTALASRTPETPTRRDVRLLAGTGFLGGFTTYSSLATDAALLLQTSTGVAVGYAIVSVFAGVLVAWGGIALAAHTFRGRKADA